MKRKKEGTRLCRKEVAAARGGALCHRHCGFSIFSSPPRWITADNAMDQARMEQ